MKKTLTSILAIISFVALAQAPQQISYQAIARQANGAVIPNKSIGVKFIIYQGTISSSTISYEETHNATTNQFGLFTLFIGGGSPLIGAFNTINWATGPYFIETQIDPAGGTSYSSIGTQQLMSVPYALFAEKAGNASPTPTITGNGLATVTPTTGSLFSVAVPTPALNYASGTNVLSLTQGTAVTTATLSGSGSNTISITGLGATTVTPNGAGNVFTINTPSYSAGTGISISSGVITNTATSITLTLVAGANMIVNPTIASNSYTVSAPNYSLSTPSNTLLLLSNGNNNSTAIIPTQSLSLIGSTLTSGVPTNSVNLATLPGLWTASGGTLYPTTATRIGIGTTTPNNSIQVAGLINFENNGANTSLGVNAGSGTNPNNFFNTFVGHNAGQAVGTSTTSSDSNNSYYGALSGKSSVNTVNNAFFGSNSGINNLSGSYNTYLGSYSGQAATSGANNTFVGYNSGINNTSGNSNTFLGSGADLGSTIQRTNATAIGYNAKVDTNNAMVLGGLFSNSINVGIGVTKPTALLHILSSNTNTLVLDKQLKMGHANQPTRQWIFSVDATAHMSLKNENNGTLLNVMDFDNNNGNIGIGVSPPAQKLDVAGNIQIPATNNYMYASPKTDYYSVSALSLNTEGTYSRANLAGGVYISNGTAGTQGNLYTGINLPNGAVVSSLDAYVLDNDGVAGHDISYIQLWRQDGAVGSSYGNAINMAQTPGTSTTSSAIVKLSTTTISNPTIDNVNYTYYLRVASVQAAPNLMVFKIVISYSVIKTN